LDSWELVKGFWGVGGWVEERKERVGFDGLLVFL
jgi:hypothetical protein